MGCEVKQCCCGCSLKTGSMAIGIVEAVLSGVCLIWVSLTTTNYSLLRDSLEEDFDTADATEEETKALNGAMSALTIAMAIMIVAAVILVLHLLFAILLACGAAQEKPSLIKSWIIYSIVCLVLDIILFIISSSMENAYGASRDRIRSMGSFTFGTALKIYFVIVVRSYHIELTRPGDVKSFV